MKKIIIYLISILLFIYIILSLLGMKDSYGAERAFWGLNRQLNFIASHNESTPDFTVDQLAARYRAYIEKYSKNIYSRQAQLMLGNLYALRKNYTQARLEYQKAVCPDKELSAQAEATIAKTYELEKNGEKALAVYKNIIRDYPLTSTGFFVPLYLTTLSESAFPDALSFYQDMAAKYPNTKIEYNALRLVVICQLKEKNWSGAVKTMGELILKYPAGKALAESVRGINILCVTKLHDYDRASNIYRQFIQKYPNHPADPTLKKMIKDLQLLKSKRLIIQTKKR